VCFFSAAIDLTYGVVLCFGCHDYVYCDEVDTIAQSQRQLVGSPLGMFSSLALQWISWFFWHKLDKTIWRTGLLMHILCVKVIA